MSYLLDKRIKRNNFFKVAILLVFLFIAIYFRTSVFNGLAYFSNIVFRPVLVVGNNISEKFNGVSAYFGSKRTLFLQNEDLTRRISEMEARLSNYNSIVADDAIIKEILGRKNENTPMILAGILAKPDQSVYGSLIVDAGKGQGVNAGSLVFADGNVPIGKVDTVFPNSSKITLFSNPGEQTEVSFSLGLKQDVFMQLVGRGNGNFEMILPRDLNLPKGTAVVLPGITPHVVGTVETIISDPRDAFQKALLVSPVNIEELKFVEIIK